MAVKKPVEREVVDYVDFTGRIQAPSSVDIRPRVTGYITKMPFKEGTEVEKGALLFEIDPRPYQAQLDKAQGDVVLNEARLKLAVADNVRAKKIHDLNAGAISKQDLDKYQAAEEEADAAVKASKASLESFRINLEFCQVTSPIAGRVSKYNLTLGNLANADSTLLTTVVSQDPMYVYFDVDELTLLELSRKIMKEARDPVQAETLPVLMGLGDEGQAYPHQGVLNFADNVVNASTGTLSVRGVFSNPPTPSRRRLLKPGMFVRVRLPTGRAHPAILVDEQALGSDQGRKYLLVVDQHNKVQYRPVTVGPLQDDGLRVIASGLEAGETVIVRGLQLVRPGMEVKPEVSTDPPKANALGTPAGAAAASTSAASTSAASAITAASSTAAPATTAEAAKPEPTKAEPAKAEPEKKEPASPAEPSPEKKEGEAKPSEPPKSEEKAKADEKEKPKDEGKPKVE